MITLLVKDAFKDMDDMQNLRPVSLMCTMKKLATRIMTDRLQKAAETRGTYTDMQFGFRAEHSTKQAIARLQAAISDARSSQRPICVAYLDLSAKCPGPYLSRR